MMEKTRQVRILELITRIGLFILILTLGMILMFLIDETQRSVLPGLSEGAVQVVTTGGKHMMFGAALTSPPLLDNTTQADETDCSVQPAGCQRLDGTMEIMTYGSSLETAADSREDRVYVLTDRRATELFGTGQEAVELVANPHQPASTATPESRHALDSNESPAVSPGFPTDLTGTRVLILVPTVALAMLVLLDRRVWQTRFTLDF